MGDENKIDNIFDVLGGNKEFKVGIDNQQMVLLALLLMLAVFIGVFTANKLSK
jgi:hypothetical protein